MSRPKLLLIDELSLGLVPCIVTMLAQTLRHIRDLGISILLVEQDVAVALDLASRGHVSLAGRDSGACRHPCDKAGLS